MESIYLAYGRDRDGCWYTFTDFQWIIMSCRGFNFENVLARHNLMLRGLAELEFDIRPNQIILDWTERAPGPLAQLESHVALMNSNDFELPSE